MNDLSFSSLFSMTFSSLISLSLKIAFSNDSINMFYNTIQHGISLLNLVDVVSLVYVAVVIGNGKREELGDK